MNARNRKFFALLQDTLLFATRFPVISRFSDMHPAAPAPARLRFTRIDSSNLQPTTL
jgi:hypothetical protein